MALAPGGVAAYCHQWGYGVSRTALVQGTALVHRTEFAHRTVFARDSLCYPSAAAYVIPQKNREKKFPYISITMGDLLIMREIHTLDNKLPKVLVWLIADYVNFYNEEQKKESVRGISLFARHAQRYTINSMEHTHSPGG